MSGSRHRDVVRFAREEADAALRGVVRYRDDDLRAIYRREGVDPGTLRPRVELTVAQARAKFRHAAELPSVDDPDWHVEFFGGVVVVYLRETPTEGTLLSLDTVLGGQLVAFLSHCADVLAGPGREEPGSSPQQRGDT